MDEKITIDKETLKAIASDTRLDIIKQLDRKKQTLSDLSKSLKLSGPTIKEHLDVLSNAGLVRKEDSLRKWKYYSLTFKGKGLLRPNETKLFLTLLISIIVGLGIFMLLGLFSGMGSAVSRDSSQANSVDMMVSSVDNTAMIVGESPKTKMTDAEITSQSSGDLPETTIKDKEKQRIVEEPIDTIKNSLFNLNYFVLAIVILIIFLVFILYINEKQKRK